MGLMSMTMRRVRKVIAWMLAIVVLVLLGAGAFYLVTVV